MNPHDDPRDLRRIKNADNQKIRCLDQARRDEENEQRHTRHAQPGVIEYESVQRATLRLDPVRREEENDQRHARRAEPGVIEYESIQRATARLDPVRR